MRATAAEIADLEARCDIVPAKRTYAISAPYVVDTLITPRVSVVVPIRTPNPLNSGKGKSRHYWARAKESATQKEAVLSALIGVEPWTWRALESGCVVTLTRMSAGHLDEFDALPASLKHVRDVVAQKLFGGTIGQRDTDARARWVCKQLRTPQKTYGVLIDIRPEKPTCV